MKKAIKGGEQQAADSAPYDDARAEERHVEMMEAIKLLRGDLERLGHVDEQEEEEAEHVDQEVMQDYKQQIIEATNLRRDLQELSDAITRTKQEIAMLASDADDDKIHTASVELSAVVKDTEAATDNIIHSAETIEEISSRLRNDVKDDHGHGLIDEMGEQVVNIFEACNFQDITGQRITKVVNTMNFIDDRIHKMMDIWGGSELFQELVPEEEKVATGEELHGPALPEERISQDDIDALFD